MTSRAFRADGSFARGWPVTAPLEAARKAAGACGADMSLRSSNGRLRMLVLTSLYPSAARSRHGIFVETRLRKILATGDIEAHVVAPVPWFPFRGSVFGSYGAMARTPRVEERFGIEIAHPRFIVIPKVGMALQAAAFARSAISEIRAKMVDGFDFDLIDAHFFYPDGVAAAAVAAAFGKPFVVTARGSDINLFARLPAPRKAIVAAASKAAAVIAVSAALKHAMQAIGIDGKRITVLRNGVDLEVFAPQPRDAARARFGLERGVVIAAVGNLHPEKGVDLIVRCLPHLSRPAALLVVGEGPERPRLVRLARALGVDGQVHFCRNLPQAELAWAYSAADVLVLASMREGWPNVLLEAMACGTPVVATDVGGVREIVTTAAAGLIVSERSPEALAAAISNALANPPSRQAVRLHASQFDWESVARDQRELYFEAIRRQGIR